MPGLTYNTALMILAISAVASNSILALWAAFGRAHWFWRVVAIEGVCALLLIVPVPDLVWSIVGHCVFAVLPVCAIRAASAIRQWLKGRSLAGTGQPQWQFTLRDIFFTTTAIAIAVAELMRILPLNWGGYDLGALIGLATLCIGLGTIGRRWRKARFVIAMIVLVLKQASAEG